MDVMNKLKNALGIVGRPPVNDWVSVNQIETAAKDSDLVLYNLDAFYRYPDLSMANFNSSNLGYSLVIYDPTGQFSDRRLTFPLPPQSINIGVPVASTLTATMKGMVEDHGGAPFRPITITGSSGVNLFSYGPKPYSAASGVIDNLSYAFKNTIQKVNKAISSVQKVISAFSGGQMQPPEEPPLNIMNSEEILSGAKNSGFVWIHQLARFLDFYIATKRTKEGKNYRLAWNMYKDNMYYDCILKNFSFTKPPGTLEYQYQINLVAYRRCEKSWSLYNGSALLAPSSTAANPVSTPTLANITAGLKQSRLALIDAFSVLNGVKSDFYETVLGPMNALGAFLDTAASGAKQVKDWWSWNDVTDEWRAAFNALANSANNVFGDYGTPEHNRAAQEARDNPVETVKPEGLSLADAAVESGDIATVNNMMLTSLDSSNSDPAKKDELIAILAPKIDPLDFTPDKLATQLDQMIRSVDIINDKLFGSVEPVTPTLVVSGQQFDKTGVLEALGASTVPESTVVAISTDNMAISKSLNDSVMCYMAAIKYLRDLQKISGVDDYSSFYSSYATNNGISYQNSSSKVMIPMPPSTTLEQLAVQYLGDASRWIEIASINGLRAPYVDEEGFDLAMNASGGGNIISLSTSQNLYIGQRIGISSDTQPTDYRFITAIEVVSSIVTVVTVDGIGDMAKFELADNATIHADLPNTVNYLKLIAIPSTVPANATPTMQLAPNQTDLSQLAAIAKVDFLLQSDGDLLLKANDVMLAIGYQNIVQAAMIKLRTKQGSLVHDPSFGNPIYAGMSTAEVDVQATVKALNESFAGDPRFNGLVGTRVRKIGTTALIDTIVMVRGFNFNMPLTTELPR